MKAACRVRCPRRRRCCRRCSRPPAHRRSRGSIHAPSR
jgi:hypothetical protein